MSARGRRYGNYVALGLAMPGSKAAPGSADLVARVATIRQQAQGSTTGDWAGATLAAQQYVTQTLESNATSVQPVNVPTAPLPTATQHGQGYMIGGALFLVAVCVQYWLSRNKRAPAAVAASPTPVTPGPS